MPCVLRIINSSNDDAQRVRNVWAVPNRNRHQQRAPVMRHFWILVSCSYYAQPICAIGRHESRDKHSLRYTPSQRTSTSLPLHQVQSARYLEKTHRWEAKRKELVAITGARDLSAYDLTLCAWCLMESCFEVPTTQSSMWEASLSTLLSILDLQIWCLCFRTMMVRGTDVWAY